MMALLAILQKGDIATAVHQLQMEAAWCPVPHSNAKVPPMATEVLLCGLVVINSPVCVAPGSGTMVAAAVLLAPVGSMVVGAVVEHQWRV